MFYDILESPIGSLTVASDGQYLRALHIQDDRYFTGVPADWIRRADDPVLVEAAAQLRSYFDGSGTFSVPVAFDGSDFQKQVWQELQHIPAGQTTTYTELAARIGRPKAVRAVGTAVGRNPLCIIVPCHRVLAASGGLGGYVAGLERKQYLLNLEAAL